MIAKETQSHLDQISQDRRRWIGLLTVTVTLVLTVLAWILDSWAGNRFLGFNYLVSVLELSGLLASVAVWGVNRPVFVGLASSIYVGFVCSLFLPGGQGAPILIVFSAVPLFYILGGMTWGRTASAGFLALLVGLVVFRRCGWIPEPLFVFPPDRALAAVGCLALQFIMAEANEGEHRRRLGALLDHQFREPNSGLPNRNALSQLSLEPGKSLVLLKFGNLALEESWRPGALGQEVRKQTRPGQDLYWIAEDEYVVVDASGTSPLELERLLLEGLFQAGLPGIHSRSPVQVVCLPVRDSPEPAAALLIEAELQLLLGPRGAASAKGAPVRVQDTVRAIRDCFRGGRLSAVFQPIYDGTVGGIAVLEALTRLDLGGKSESPEPYLGFIESLGLDRQLTEFILGEAVKLGLDSDYSVSLNLTYRDLEDSAFLPRLLEACALFQNRKNKLIFELTEHVAFSDHQLLVRFITQVHDAGGLVFLDDFGMGYSNYSSVVAARFDAIKVAGSIVLQAPASDEIRVLLAGIAEFSRASGIHLVAEHISDPSIYAMVHSEGIRYLQGYLLQRPIPGVQILAGEFEFALETDHDLAALVNSKSTPFPGGAFPRKGDFARIPGHG
jgi:EAL domain-containing protein (putative c-di-GMP-specific phosphodiesterase class I)